MAEAPKGTLIPETAVLAIASHVVHGYVGNTMACLVMQGLGCDVSALNTVQYSNHTGYGRFRGIRHTDREILDLYEGLCENHLAAFDFLLSGYAPGANAVKAVGLIAEDQKARAKDRGKPAFWVLDPVMGDAGHLYVHPDVVPAYRRLLSLADLILPNQFELELLAETEISSLESLTTAISKMHAEYHVPHLVVTSVTLVDNPDIISVVGSSKRRDGSPRIFRVDVPRIDCHFGGTGDMFAALTVVGLRELNRQISDDVTAVDLPLARIVERVLDSMHTVLTFTKDERDQKLRGLETARDDRLSRTKAAEVRVVRCFDQLRAPQRRWRATALQR